MQNTRYPKLVVLILKVLLLIVCLIVVLGIYSFVQYNNRSVDLITQDNNWQFFPGATVTKDGIHFQPLNRVIVHQDGSAGQPNPPVNLAGQHLSIKGDFKMTAILIGIDKQASLRLYAKPPILYDQWRYEPPSVYVTVDAENNSVTARIFDGSSNASMDIRTYSVPLPPHVVISLEHVKNQINILENGQLLGNMPDHNIFDSGTIWLGADGVLSSSGWTLAALDIQPMGDGQVKTVPIPSLVLDHNDNTSLRNLAETHHQNLKIGSAVSLEPLLTDEQYRNLMLDQFSILTPENSMKPQFIHPESNVYDFSEADQIVDIVSRNAMAVHGHALVYDKSSPDWMIKSLKTERQKIMTSHIENVVSHFKGKVAEWDVVNEPFSKKNALYKNGGSGLEPNIWFEAMGETYIDLAFKAAHQADPAAKLYLNDYGVENDGQHWDALLSLVKRLQQRGVPIDGVGFESHVYTDGDYINAQQFKKHMKTLADLGLLTRISEIDVTGDDAKEQVNQYRTALDICLRAPNCTSYTTWGVTDLYGSTTRSDRYPLVYGTSLLWDKNMKAKPAYYELQKRLQQ